MAAENLKSTSITNLDASPVVANTKGTGAPAYRYTVDDTVACTAVGIAAIGSTYQIVRIPSNAKIKSFEFATSAAVDTNSSVTLAIDFNLAFSDSTVDGTSAAYQGLIPTSANTGATTPVGTYSSPNKIFGTFTPTSHTAAVSPTNLTFNGIGSAYPIAKITSVELWSLFGFTNTYGVAGDPGGFFDLLAYVSTAATVGAAGVLYAKLDYVV